MGSRGDASAVLATPALDTPAANPPPALLEAEETLVQAPARLFQTRTGDEPRSYPKTGRAGTRKTGMASVSPDRHAEEAKKESEFWLDLAQKGIGALGDSVRRIASAQEREEARFARALGEALLEVAKKEAGAAAQTLPFAKVIVKAIRLSEVFADAAGKAIVEASERLGYDRVVAEIVGAREITDETMRAYRFVRGWQNNNAAQIEGILKKGLLAVVDAAIQDLFGQVEGALGKSLKSVVDQVAQHLFRRNELLAILNDVVKDRTGRIPAVRLRMEKATFHTLVDTWVKLTAGPELQKDLAPLVGGLGGKDPVHVSLLAGVLEVISRGSFEQYARHIRLQEGRDELRALLMDTARQLLDQAREGGVEIVMGDAVEVGPDRVTAPESLLKDLDRSLLPPGHYRLYMQRVAEFEAAVRRQAAIHRETRRRFQAEIDAANRKQAADPEVDVDVVGLAMKRQDELDRLRKRAVAELENFVEQVEKEVGTRYEGLPTSFYLTGHDPQRFWWDTFPIGLDF